MKEGHMNILVYGAGIIGSVYAAQLQEAGYNISLLARGQRAISLRTHGILLENVLTKQQTTTRVIIVDHLVPTDSYDMVIVTVRLDQLASILPDLAANHQIPTVLFLLNNPDGMQRLEMLEPQRILLGFPSIGGTQVGEVVRYYHAPKIAQTTLGKEDGRVTPRLRELATAFKKAGFSVSLNSDMQGWLTTHGLIDLCLAGAVIMTGGSSAELSQSRKHMAMAIQGIREGFRVLEAQGTPISPVLMKVVFSWLPRWLAILCLQYILRTAGTLALDPHLHASLDEVRQIGKDLMGQLQKSSLPTPTLNRFMRVLETAA